MLRSFLPGKGTIWRKSSRTESPSAEPTHIQPRRVKHPKIDPEHFSLGLIAQFDRHSFHVEELATALWKVANSNIYERLNTFQEKTLQLRIPALQNDDTMAMEVLKECKCCSSLTPSSIATL